ncbi:MAG: hypothetical protein AMK71_09210 [Nitrospira bacterium SG8_35_4]|nr:MAG: hypothetical protein AMK71_09210 [Nitrospira bacterium SG8_35_4]
MKEDINSKDQAPPGRTGFLQVLGYAALVVIIIMLLGTWWVKYNIYASEFSPTTLNQKEQKVLDAKISRLDISAHEGYFTGKGPKQDQSAPLEPEAYSETGAKREISLTEKELNALIANNPEMARMVAIDLSDNLVSLKLVVPMDEDIPVMGGKTLRLKLGLTLGYEDNQLIVAVKGVSLGGIPIPNAWLGYMKNRNLVEEFGDEGGFWALFAEGVRDIKVRSGHINIRLKE